MSTPLDSMIKELEEQKQIIDDALIKLKEARDTIEDLPPDIAAKLEKSIAKTVREPRTNFERVLQYLGSQDTPQTIREMMDGLGISRGSLSVVLYDKKHRNRFETTPTGEGKTLAWKLRNGSSVE